MWKNRPFYELVEWMRKRASSDGPYVFGMDCYCKEEAKEEVLNFFDFYDRENLGKARARSKVESTFSLFPQDNTQASRAGVSTHFVPDGAARQVPALWDAGSRSGSAQTTSAAIICHGDSC